MTYTTKKSIRFISVIFLILFILSNIFVLFSCRKNSSLNVLSTADNPSGVKPSYINPSNEGVREQSVSDLYNKVAMSDLKKKTLMTDPFNLKLSHNNYFYTDSIRVQITCDIEDAEIFYTLDGSEPVKDVSSQKYSEPILLEKVGNNNPYILKAAAFSEDSQSRVLTHTYFVSEQIADRFSENLYIFSITSDPYNLYDYENGILISGKLRDEWAQDHRRRDIIPPDPANFNLRGKEGERPAYIEAFTPNGECIISQNAGIRVHGGWSRDSDRQSLALYARNEYDTVFDKFYYPFFKYFGEAKRRDESETLIYDYKTLLLRNGANDRWGANMREELSSVLAKQAGFTDYKEVAPAAVFLNGEYYGFMWLEQFYNEDYFIDQYGGDNKNMFEIGEWGEPNPGNVTDDAKFEEYANIMDLDNYMLYYAFEIYTGNRDWPHNNLKYWRYAGDEDGTYINKYFDGKYRMLLYDDEMAWGMYGAGSRERTIQRIRRDGSSRSFNALTKRDDMIEKFCSQMMDLLNSVFTYESIEDAYNRIVDLYDEEIRVAIRNHIPGGYSRRTLESERQSILKFAETRADYVIQDMVKSYSLTGDTYNISVTGNENAHVKLNTLELNGGGKIHGSYFTEHSVKITAEPYPGYIVSGWKINGKDYYKEFKEFSGREAVLDYSLAANGRIDAEVILSRDEEYFSREYNNNIVINKITLDSNADIIELYNPGDTEVILKNIYISDNKDNLKKFHIKILTVSPKSTTTYCGRNYADDYNQKNIHRNEIVDERYVFDFKINPGDTIYISDETGTVVNSVSIPKKFNPDKGDQFIRQNDGSYKVIKNQ